MFLAGYYQTLSEAITGKWEDVDVRRHMGRRERERERESKINIDWGKIGAGERESERGLVKLWWNYAAILNEESHMKVWIIQI